MDVGHLYYRRIDSAFDTSLDTEKLSLAVADMRREAERDMRGEGFEVADLHYVLQLFIADDSAKEEIKLDTEIDFFQREDVLAELIEQAENAINTKGSKSSCVLSSVACLVTAEIPGYQAESIEKIGSAPETAIKSQRKLFTGENSIEVPVYDRHRLGYGNELAGPALVESDQTTLLLSQNWRMAIDQLNNAILTEM